MANLLLIAPVELIRDVANLQQYYIIHTHICAWACGGARLCVYIYLWLQHNTLFDTKPGHQFLMQRTLANTRILEKSDSIEEYFLMYILVLRLRNKEI